MSKIKDLLAEVEDIDDLKPEPHKYGLDFYQAVQQMDCERFATGVCESCKNIRVEDEIADRANFEVDVDDDGHECVYMENYTDIIKSIVQETLDTIIEQQQLDFSDTEYFKILDLAESMVADYYADYESQLCEDEMADHKYKLDELRERNGQC